MYPSPSLEGSLTAPILEAKQILSPIRAIHSVHNDMGRDLPPATHETEVVGSRQPLLDHPSFTFKRWELLEQSSNLLTGPVSEGRPRNLAERLGLNNVNIGTNFANTEPVNGVRKPGGLVVVGEESKENSRHR